MEPAASSTLRCVLTSVAAQRSTILHGCQSIRLMASGRRRRPKDHGPRPAAAVVNRSNADPSIPILPNFPGPQPTKLKRGRVSKSYGVLEELGDGNVILAARAPETTFSPPSEKGPMDFPTFLNGVQKAPRHASDEHGNDPKPEPSATASLLVRAASAALPPLSSKLPNYSGSKHLTRQDVYKIRQLRGNGLPVSMVAKQMKCSPNYVRQVAPMKREVRAKKWVEWFREKSVTDQKRIVKRSLERELW